MLSPSDEASLRDLAHHWDTAYDFAVSDGTWTARPRGERASILTADSAHELREKVRLDYAERRSAKTGPLLGERMST